MSAGDDRSDDNTSTLVDADVLEVASKQPSEGSSEDAAMRALREERDRLKDQLLRTAADFDNFRKRSKKELDDAERRGREDTIRELLPVFDNLERAMGAARNATEVSAIVEGIKMVLKLFEDQAGHLGITKVPTVGQRFDPALHDAIQQKETDEHPPGTVIAEVVPGYRLGDRLVRPAMVVVARRPTASA